MRRTALAAQLAIVVAPLNASAKPPTVVANRSQVLARCPTALKPGAPVQAGAKLYGRVPAAGASLYRAAIATESAATVDPSQGFNEQEFDEDDNASTFTASFDRLTPRPLSLVCYYGVSQSRLGGAAALLIPLPASGGGRCRFGNTARPHTMVCTGR